MERRIAPRHGVRLGSHADGFVFEAARGLHDPEMGLAVVGGSLPDPEVMWEEHGTDQTCRYLELHREATLNPDLGPFEGRPNIAARLGSDDERVRLSGIIAAFGLERAENVNTMLASLREGQGRIGGHAWIVQQTERFQRRRAMIRILHAAQAQPDRPFTQRLGEPEPLARHSAGGDSTLDHLYVPLVLLSSLFTMGIVADRVVKEASEAYLLVVLFGDDVGLRLRDGDTLWAELYPPWPMWHDPHRNSRQWVKDTTAPAVRLPGQVLVERWTQGLNRLLTEATDLGRYRDADGVLDARNAYRELRTLDRIFLNCGRIQSRPDDHVGRVSAAFEFFDLLPSILPERIGPTQIYGTLLHPDRVEAILGKAFSHAPSHVKAHLTERTAQVVAHIRQETLETVVPGRRTDSGVLVGSKQTPPVPPDEYVAKLFHQLRNTHHGYELDAPSQRDLLDSHTGHIAYGFPELVVLLTVALIADPETGLAGGWFDQRLSAE
jgi:hypothetical protein